DLVGRPEILRRAVKRPDQKLLQRRADHRTAAEPHDRHAGRHAAAVREPANQRADGRNVAETETASSNHAVAEVYEPELVPRDAEAADQIAAAPAERRDHADLARPDLLEPLACDRGRQPEEHDRDGVNPD